MKACLALTIFLFASLTHADELDDLIARRATIAEVLPVIHANGKRNVETLIPLQRRAIDHFRSAEAYKLILSDGLSHKQVKYRRSSCRLLLETFQEYLLYKPRPKLDDVLALISANNSFKIHEFIHLMKMALSVYLSSNSFKKILVIGLESANSEYKRAASDLLVKNFSRYLQRKPKPPLEDALSLTTTGVFNSTQLHTFVGLLLLAYPDPSDLPRIAKRGFTTGDGKFPNETFDLVHKTVSRIVSEQKPDPSWFIWLRELSKLGMIFSPQPATSEKLQHLYRKWLRGKTSDEELLSFANPFRTCEDLSFFLLLRKMHLKARPKAKPLLLADCFNFDGSLARSCVALIDDFDEGQSIAGCYTILADLRNDGFATNEIYKKYQNMMEQKSFTQLNDEVKAHNINENVDDIDHAAKIREIPSSCPVCLTDTPEEAMHVLQKCQHALCKECLIAHINAQLLEGMDVPCTELSCQASLSSADFQALELLDAEHTFKRRALNATISRIRGAHFCNNGHCPDAFIPVPHEPVVKNTKKFRFFASSSSVITDHHYQCRTCNETQCARCGYTHPGVSCKRSQQNMKEAQKAELKMFEGKNGTVKPCPQCQGLIEKHGGCDHMTCEKCKYEFFWHNLKPYKE